MSRKEKLLKKLKSTPQNFTYNELKTLLNHLGFVLDDKGKTSGTRVAFYHEKTKLMIRLHKPDPENQLKRYQINEILKVLNKLE